MKLWPFCVERRAAARRETSLVAEFVVLESFSGKRLSPTCSAQVLNLSPKGCCLALGGWTAADSTCTAAWKTPRTTSST